MLCKPKRSTYREKEKMRKKRHRYRTVNLPIPIAKQIEPFINRRLENGLYFKSVPEFIFWCIRENLYELEKRQATPNWWGGN